MRNSLKNISKIYNVLVYADTGQIIKKSDQ